jgi:hypothetical protein
MKPSETERRLLHHYSLLVVDGLDAVTVYRKLAVCAFKKGVEDNYSAAVRKGLELVEAEAALEPNALVRNTSEFDEIIGAILDAPGPLEALTYGSGVDAHTNSECYMLKMSPDAHSEFENGRELVKYVGSARGEYRISVRMVRIGDAE